MGRGVRLVLLGLICRTAFTVCYERIISPATRQQPRVRRRLGGGGTEPRDPPLTTCVTPTALRYPQPARQGGQCSSTRARTATKPYIYSLHRGNINSPEPPVRENRVRVSRKAYLNAAKKKAPKHRNADRKIKSFIPHAPPGKQYSAFV
jgi:hypothetical protein